MQNSHSAGKMRLSDCGPVTWAREDLHDDPHPFFLSAVSQEWLDHPFFLSAMLPELLDHPFFLSAACHQNGMITQSVSSVSAEWLDHPFFLSAVCQQNG